MRNLSKLVLLTLALFVLASGLSRAAEKGVNVGDKGPAIEAKDDQGKTWKSSDYYGKKIVVYYFYPADFTGGCTKQACAFRDDFKKLADQGIVVVGVSGNSSETHAAFKKHHKLPFTLLADPDGAIAKKFGVPCRKGRKISVKIDGKALVTNPGVLASRWTFVVGKDGKVIHKNTKVNARMDSKNVLKAIKESK